MQLVANQPKKAWTQTWMQQPAQIRPLLVSLHLENVLDYDAKKAL